MKFVFAASLIVLAMATPDPAALFAAGEFAAASAAADAVLSHTPSDPRALLVSGTVALYNDRFDVAARELEAIPASDPAAPRVRRMLDDIGRRQTIARTGGVSFATPTVRIPFESTDPLPVVAVNVDGHRALFQIDTGAPVIALDADFAREIHLAPLGAGHQHFAFFANGRRAAIRQTKVADFSLGGVRVKDLTADLLPLRRLNPGRERIDGTLGTGVFERFAAVTLDYVHGNLVMYGPGSDLPVAAETTVPLWIVGDHFLVTHGTIAGSYGPVVVDTGLPGAGVAPSSAVIRRSQLVPHPRGELMTPNGTHVAGSDVIVPTVSIGASTEHDVRGMYAPGPSMFDRFPFTVEGAISHTFFRHRALTIDFVHMRMLISARTPTG